MDYFLAVLFIIFMIAGVLLQILNLPGNWASILFLVIWKFIGPASTTHELTLLFFAAIIAMAAAGELLEWLIQLKVGKKLGSSTKGNIGGIIGSIIGAIVMLPLFFGFGALLGALLGAFAGCLLVELIAGRPREEAVKAAWGAFMGRGMGMGLKLGIGTSIVWLTIVRVWPSAVETATAVL